MSLINFYTETSDFYKAIFEEIKVAKKSIFLETYIFEYFSASKYLIQLLEEAQQRGVEVRVIFDGFGSLSFLNNHLSLLEEKNINYRIFNPVPFLYNRWKPLRFSFSIQNILKVGNRRNHRKLVIIDEKVVFLGSQNWASVHISTPTQPTPWKDVGCRIESERLDSLLRSSEQIWKASLSNNSFRPFKGYIRLKNHNPLIEKFKLNFSFYHRYQVYKYLIKNIRSAQTHITIASAYFIPKRSFIRALKKAHKRGVKVQILTSGPTDVQIVKLAALGLYENLLSFKIPIFEYSKTHFHSKYFLFDNQKVLLGSYNMNHRSLMHDLELLYEIQIPEKVQEFQALVKQDLHNSTELSLQNIKNRPWYVKLASKVLYRIRYIL